MAQEKIKDIILKEFPYTKRSVDLLVAGVRACYPKIGYGQSDVVHYDANTFTDQVYGSIDSNELLDAIRTVTQKDDLTEAYIIATSYENVYISLDTTEIPRGTVGISPNMPPSEELGNWVENINLREGGYKTTHEKALEVGKKETQRFISETEKGIENKKATIVTTPKVELATVQDTESKESKTEIQPDVESSQRVFISYKTGQEPKPKIIVLSKEEREDLQTLKNDFNQKGKEKFAEEIANKIETNWVEHLSETERIDFAPAHRTGIAQAVSEDLALKIEGLPDKIGERIEIIDDDPIVALLTPQAAEIFNSPETSTAIATAVNDIINTHNQLQEIAINSLGPVYGSFVPVLYQKIDKEQTQDRYEVSKTEKAENLVKAQISAINEYVKVRNEILTALKEEGMSAKKEDVDQLAWTLSRRFEKIHNEGFSRAAARGLVKPEGLEETSRVKSYLFDSFQKHFNVTHTLTDGKLTLLVNGRPLSTFGGHIYNVASKLSSSTTNITAGLDKVSAKYAGAGNAAKIAVTKAIQGLATKVAGGAIGGTVLGTGLATALNTVAPIIGAIIGFIIGLLLDKLLGWLVRFTKEHLKELGAGIIILGFFANAPVMILGGMAAVVLGAGVTSTLAGIGSFISVMTMGLFGNFIRFIAWILIGIAIVVTFFTLILYIINNSAYVIPPSSKFGGSTGGGGIVPADCQANDYPKPARPDILFSADGNYAFPVEPYSETSYPCYHWDGEYAVDVFTKGTRQPIVAYTSGTINMVVMNNPIGGKYIILAGGDGRYYYYAHNCAVYVKPGDRVGIGDVIAVSDTTGSAAGTPEHLHFAINEYAGNTFPGGGGDVCPQTDFEEKFAVGVCPEATTRCVKP